MRTVHCPLKWPQGAPLSAETPPNVEPQACHGRPCVSQPKDGDAFQRLLAGDGWTDPTPNLGHIGLRWPFQQPSWCGLAEEVLEGQAFGGEGAPLLHRGSTARVADPVVGAWHPQRSPGRTGEREEAAEWLD